MATPAQTPEHDLDREVRLLQRQVLTTVTVFFRIALLLGGLIVAVRLTDGLMG